jgi:hypothetical protein
LTACCACACAARRIQLRRLISEDEYDGGGGGGGGGGRGRGGGGGGRGGGGATTNNAFAAASLEEVIAGARARLAAPAAIPPLKMKGGQADWAAVLPSGGLIARGSSKHQLLVALLRHATDQFGPRDAIWEAEARKEMRGEAAKRFDVGPLHKTLGYVWVDDRVPAVDGARLTIEKKRQAAADAACGVSYALTRDGVDAARYLEAHAREIMAYEGPGGAAGASPARARAARTPSGGGGGGGGGGGARAMPAPGRTPGSGGAPRNPPPPAAKRRRVGTIWSVPLGLCSDFVKKYEGESWARGYTQNK